MITFFLEMKQEITPPIDNPDDDDKIENIGDVILFENYSDIDDLIRAINNIRSFDNVKYILLKNCVNTGSSQNIQNLYNTLYTLIANGKVKSAIIYNSSDNESSARLPSIRGGIIKIDLQKDRYSGCPVLIDSLNNDMLKDRKVVNKLIKSIDILRSDYRETKLEYNAKISKQNKFDYIISGKVVLSCSSSKELEELLIKCVVSEDVRIIELDVLSSFIPNELIDLMFVKFPNCKLVKSKRPVEKSLSDYISKYYSGVIAPYNIIIMDNNEIEELVRNLEPMDKELVRQVIHHIAEIDPRNHKPLLDCVRITVNSLRNVNVNSNTSGQEEKYKCRKILNYLSNFPIGDIRIRFDFGDLALGRHIEAMSRIADIIQPGMNIDQKKAILNYFVYLLTAGNVGKARIPFFIGPPGSGKSASIAVIGGLLGYLHWFLPDNPDKYINPTDEQIEAAIAFGVETRDLFSLIINIPGLSGKAAIEGGLKIYVGSDAGILRLYSKKWEYAGRSCYYIFISILWDEIDKASEKATKNDEFSLHLLMPLATSDAKASDQFCDISHFYHPTVSVFAANFDPEAFDALWNRTNRIRVPGFSNIQKRDLIFNLVTDVVKNSFSNMEVIISDAGDIELNTQHRRSLGMESWVVIKKESFNAIISMSGDDAGLRTLKDNISNLISNLSIQGSKNVAVNDFSTIIVDNKNISQYLSFMVPVKKNIIQPGSAVCAVNVETSVISKVVTCTQNENTANSKFQFSPGPSQQNHKQYQLVSVQGGSDIGNLTFNALVEILKKPTSEYSDSKYMSMAKKIKSIENSVANNHWILDIEYNINDKFTPRVAGTTAVIAYISKLMNSAPIGFAIGYCDISGKFHAVENAPECFNLCINKIVNLDDFDNGTQEKVIVVIPRVYDGVNIYDKLGVPQKLRHLIEIREADNIFDVISYIIPGFEHKDVEIRKKAVVPNSVNVEDKNIIKAKIKPNKVAAE